MRMMMMSDHDDDDDVRPCFALCAAIGVTNDV